MSFDKSVWPCYTPDLFWALSDNITRCAVLKSTEDDAVEYEIQTNNLPDGRIGLWRFNALRNISIDIDAWPKKLRTKIQSATLCLGDKALEEVVRGPHNSDDIESLKFTMFTNDSILPLFVIDNDPLIVRILFRPALTNNEILQVPSKAIDASGLLVKIKSKGPFFVAGCSDSILTWDGAQSRVISKHLIDKEDTDSYTTSEDDSTENRTLIDPIARWNVVNSDTSNFEELWKGLQTDADMIDTRPVDPNFTSDNKEDCPPLVSVNELDKPLDQPGIYGNSTTFFMPTPRD